MVMFLKNIKSGKLTEDENNIILDNFIEETLKEWNLLFNKIVLNNSLYNNNKILDIKIDGYIFVDKKYENNKRDMFDIIGILVPKSILIKTERYNGIVDIFKEEEINTFNRIIEKDGFENFTNYLSGFLRCQTMTSSKSSINIKLKSFFVDLINESNFIKHKQDLENNIFEFNKDPENEKLYQRAKFSLAKFLKSHYFSKNSQKIKFSNVLNRNINFDSYTQDYILYNFLRNYPLNRGIKKIKTQKLMYHCVYDSPYIYSSDKNNLMRIKSANLILLLFKINGINSFYEKIIEDINLINARDKVFDKYFLFLNYKTILRTNL